ncbi:hypothetical protein COX03_01975 [Candidatus Woesebacteria bacterium CG22_combo_CG10-13_8_21_14_all_39_10]|uniref:AAA family ATPase n=3 Tax=Candidatus Woeseibacteriota TaxID=1752722 RepID=A0A2M7X9P4_9BACT|nr:MAG: hypothetical protein COX03_01975 [Candidatus Woesebacteria bacterium CG22_combo_CG10-13_8_21_14_all_39_10]PIU71874.1 MAG: hypothetical protein COS80_00855 [Candidatus Woesebacteria bacterium CG06_land_8_20_14_3_00_39_27]PJA42874.1 MAG: hypothetical protein CO176_01175 [Candidatus Woesebacteria bacterium CG_4_9_14_3_um_filter_39_10]
MFKRRIEEELKSWKISTIRKPLVLRGARQVGKTSTVRKFAAENFENFVEINLERADQNKYFRQADTVEEFVKRAEYFTKKVILEGRTLLFIDEIQESFEILKLLRFFAEEKPNLHLIAAGSLLEAKMYGKWSVPVGRIEYMYLYPMTFFEFLAAINQEHLASDPKITHQLLVKHLEDYLLVGGMPEAVASFVGSGSFMKVQEIHQRLLVSYEEDIDKYARSSERKYLQLVMDFGPKIAGSVYKYENFGDSGYRGREIRDAINLLQRVMLLKEVPSINSINLPFVHKNKRAKKMIWLDTGIVNFVNNIRLDILKGEYKGRIMEQFVGQTLVARGFRRTLDLTYWSRNKDEGSAEVDFCFQHQNKIVGLEVKSGNTKNLKSLFSLIDLGGNKVIPVRVSWDELGVEKYHYNGKKYKILSVPFYLLEKIDEFLVNFP